MDVGTPLEGQTNKVTVWACCGAGDSGHAAWGWQGQVGRQLGSSAEGTGRARLALSSK